MKLTEAELSNLITACSTSTMRKAPAWGKALDDIANKLRAMRDQLDKGNDHEA